MKHILTGGNMIKLKSRKIHLLAIYRLEAKTGGRDNSGGNYNSTGKKKQGEDKIEGHDRINLRKKITNIGVIYKAK
jgi:hypothetical protein